jgi:AbrB family looped-hinge helix DNA binding protein
MNRFMASSISVKGQVTIPKRVRDALGLKPGSRVDFILAEGHAMLEPFEGGGIETLAGSLGKYARKRSRASDQVLIEKVRKEVADGAAKSGRSHRHKRSS